MLHFSRYKIAGIGLVLFSRHFCFLCPIFMSEKTRLSLPDILPSSVLESWSRPARRFAFAAVR